MTYFSANIGSTDFVTKNLLPWGINIKDIQLERFILNEKQNLSKYLLDNEISNAAQTLFKPFKEIEYISVEKCESKKMYDFYFICKNMTIEREEELIDAEIKLEDQYPTIHFDFVVIRHGKKNINDFIEIKNTSLVL